MTLSIDAATFSFVFVFLGEHLVLTPISCFYCLVIVIYLYFSLDKHKPININYSDIKLLFSLSWEHWVLWIDLTADIRISTQTDMSSPALSYSSVFSGRTLVKFHCMGIKKTGQPSPSALTIQLICSPSSEKRVN